MTSSSLGTLPSTTCMNDESSLLSKPFPSWSNAPYAYLTLATCSAVMGMAAEKRGRRALALGVRGNGTARRGADWPS